jgi:hypothetical protein
VATKIADFFKGDIIITLPKARFRAVYYKPAGQPQLILRQRTKTDDYEALAGAWNAANDKARELGWIVYERAPTEAATHLSC